MARQARCRQQAQEADCNFTTHRKKTTNSGKDGATKQQGPPKFEEQKACDTSTAEQERRIMC